jgi:hypothetical protein
MARIVHTPLDPPPELAHLLAEQPISRARTWNGSIPRLIIRAADQRAVLSDSRFSAVDARPGCPVQSRGMQTRRRGLARHRDRDAGPTVRKPARERRERNVPS